MTRRILCIIVVIIIMTGLGWSGQLIKDPRVKSAINLIEIWLDSEMDYKDIPGLSAGIVHDQDLIWSRGFGYAHVDKQLPATPNSIYGICSISKLFTSISVMQLRDQGKLSLDMPIRSYLPWFSIKDKFPEAPEITLRGILTHSSGLPREAGYPYWTGPDFPFPTREQIIKKLSGQEELYPAETFYQYSNLGMALAGEVVAAVSGMSFDEYVKRHILDPLDLKNTTPEIPENKKGGQLATGYSVRLREGGRKVIPFYFVRGIAPAAGFASTVEDLGKFASWQFRLIHKGGDELLSANTLREMQRVQWLDEDWGASRGFGFSVSRRDKKTFVGHGGNCPGYKSQLTLCMKDKIAVIIMSNAHDVSPSFYTRRIYNIIEPALSKALKKPDEKKEPDADLKIFTGRYVMPIGREKHILIMGENLVILYLPTDSPDRALTRLKRVDGLTFKRIRDDDSLGETVVFKADPDGNITHMIHFNQYSIKVD